MDKRVGVSRVTRGPVGSIGYDWALNLKYLGQDVCSSHSFLCFIVSLCGFEG